MKFAWDVSDAGLCPDVGRAVWGDGFGGDFVDDSPREVNRPYINQRDFETFSQARPANRPPEYQRASNPTYHTYAPQIIREGNATNGNSPSWKNTLCVVIGIIAVLLTVNFIAPDLINAIVDLAVNKIGAIGGN